MKLKELLSYWKCDLKRYTTIDKKSPLRVFLSTPGFKYMFFVRLCRYLNISEYRSLYLPLYILSRIVLRHYEYKYSIQIPYNTKIGPGFYIAHYGCIVIHPLAVIGSNVNICQGVSIGCARAGVPSIGNDVFLGAGAKVIGNVKLGNNVAVGANCVVTGDIPDNAVVAGVPARIISLAGNRQP